MVTLFPEGLFIGGLHNALYAVSAHLYQPHVRATGVGAASGAGRVGAILSACVGALSLKVAGASGFFIVIPAAASLLLMGLALFRHHVGSHDLAGLTADTSIVDGNH
jgi:AAHS family 4-hydroxybenzoate transporter-like MFS transporter